ncbi:MAG: glycogen/starch/alpha-glucan family phosphorylase [Oscillospiraceae bacterium]|jgi:starch phosphorylase|nr:glycogen/starch/alpha-glucan family phosphorylase [Oscillospiraceae bacterium]
MKSPMTKEELVRRLNGTLEFDFRINSQEASTKQLYKALSKIVVNHLKEKRRNFTRQCDSIGQKQVYYISVEFLMGRSLKTSLYNLGLNEIAEKALKEEFNVKLSSLYEEEPDAGLGNGGLGRLAACYMDAMATCAFPATGYSILYEYGIFKQKIVDGWQDELADDWLPGGEVWLMPVPDQAIEVRFGGELNEYWDNEYHNVSHVNYQSVNAVPYDMYVSGYDSPGVSKLRLWKAESRNFNMAAFNDGNYENAVNDIVAQTLTKVLYPNDNYMEGKALRLRQQYFMCAASVGDIVMRHMKTYGTLDNLHEKSAIHINDTHPTLAIPELMRVLLDDCGYSWSKSWHIAQNTFAYTNHTVMAEALETWDKDLLQRTVPRIFTIICEINHRYCEGLYNRLGDSARVERMSIVSGNRVKMANLCLDAAHSVNGVSKLHSEIIKESVFLDQFEDKPNKFKNVTNGIAYRRWLLQSNPGLTKLLEETIGKGFKKDAAELSKLFLFENDKDVLEKLAKIKRENKTALAKFVSDTMGVKLNLDSVFDVQVKRLHEYKRQQLNAMNIIAEYLYLSDNPDAAFTPKTYIFASKAAPGYYMAKQIIKLIWCLGEEIRANKKVCDKLQVVFLEDYRVTLSEILMPASEISEQISLAGTEASGTGNMKLMLNGAVTMGTYDGANVEIHSQVGDDNIFIFGMNASEAGIMHANGYSPEGYYNNNSVIKTVLNKMYSGVNGATFNDLANTLRQTDRYMCLADFDSYRAAQAKAGEAYTDLHKWNKMSLANIAGAGIFSADRAVKDYAATIWNLI